mgnify:CR=1 FL=1
MAAIALRSPQYKSITAGANSAYAICTITIGGVLRYTLRKEVAPTETALFEIGELCRDYLDITFDGTYTAQTLAIVTAINAYTASDSLVNGSTFNDIGYDAYGTFMEGANPTVPFTSLPNTLFTREPYPAADAQIYVPIGYAGVVAGIKTNSEMEYYSYTANQSEIIGTTMGVRVNINRIDCTKYGDGHKITFVNKFGALQDIWFFLKTVYTTSKKQEQFQRNIISSTGTYSVNQHTKQVFNTTASQKFTLSSGYYPEWCNQWFEQLMLSEKVWLTRNKLYDRIDQTEVVPVNVTKNSMVQKTSLNDKLIEYTFDFELSADYINNIR